MTKFVEKLKSFFRFLFFGEGLLSDITFVIFFIILIRFVVFPVLSFISGTPLPIVIVMTNSMEHNCFNPESYKKYNVSIEEIRKWPFSDGISVGDIIIATAPRDLKVGDVVIYYTPFGFPIIHRIVGIVEEGNSRYYIIKGDNNKNPINWGYTVDENKMPEKYIVGKALFKIPKIGLIKVYFVKILCSFDLYNKRTCYYLSLTQYSNC